VLRDVVEVPNNPVSAPELRDTGRNIVEVHLQSYA